MGRRLAFRVIATPGRGLGECCAGCRSRRFETSHSDNLRTWPALAMVGIALLQVLRDAAVDDLVAAFKIAFPQLRFVISSSLGIR